MFVVCVSAEQQSCEPAKLLELAFKKIIIIPANLYRFIFGALAHSLREFNSMAMKPIKKKWRYDNTALSK